MNTDVKSHLLVVGRVQGVGYRYFTSGIAAQYGLRGYVRNLWDGDVEVVVEGPRNLIEVFIDKLHVGPSLSVVKTIEIRWEEATGEFRGFSIRR